MENVIQWTDARPQTERAILGTVINTFKNATPHFISSNFNATPDSDGHLVNVMLVFKRKDGKEATITCSSKLSKLLRNGEVTKNQLAGFPICEATTRDGELFKQIQMPSGAGLISIGEFSQVEKYQVETVSAEDLIAI